VKKKPVDYYLKTWYPYLIVALVLVGSGLGIYLPFRYHLELAEKIVIGQLVIGTLSLLVILFGLYPVLRQLRISEAKPKLSLAFDELGKTDTTLDVIQGRGKTHRIVLWILNNGNAVAEKYQVDLEVDRSLGAAFMGIWAETKIYNPQQSTEDGRQTLSFSLIYPCFVRRPITAISLFLSTNDKSPQEFRMPYRVFGTWSPEERGELRVRLQKTPIGEQPAH